MASCSSLSSVLFLTFLLLLCAYPSRCSPYTNNNVAKEPAPPVFTLKHSSSKDNVVREPDSPEVTVSHKMPQNLWPSSEVPVSPKRPQILESAPPYMPRKYSSQAQKVYLSLYYETLCPYCRNFIVNSLVHAVNSDLMTIVNLRMVPWGNAYLLPNNTIICQHGEDECYLNTIHACAINLWPDVKKHFSFIYCVEQSLGSQNSIQVLWEACAQQVGLPKREIQNCYDSGRGKQLVLQYGRETGSLNPPHQYVPWVLVNQKPLFTDYPNFPGYVCKAYKGKVKPKACTSPSHPQATNSVEEEKPLQIVCHKQRSTRDSLERRSKVETPA